MLNELILINEIEQRAKIFFWVYYHVKLYKSKYMTVFEMFLKEISCAQQCCIYKIKIH